MNWDSVSSTVEHTFEWAWNTSLYGSVLIVLVLAIQFAGGKCLPARLRYALGLLVLLRLMLPAVPASSFSLYNLGRDFTAHSIKKGDRLAAVEIQALAAHPANLLPTPPTAPTSSAPASRISLLTLASVIWLAGLVISLFIIWRRHRKFSRWINSQPAFEDGRVKTLLNECRPILQVRCEVGIVRAPQPATPAMFGWRRPRLLLPAGLCEKLEDRELRMVFLHELAHVKRADVLLNWVILLVRSLHWFNPLVWLAMRRLRADRELVCDAMVMSHLAVNERRAYGNTLIKLLDDVSGAGFCPSLAPMINHKHEIKRRVTMIAQFKPTSRIAFLFTAAIIIALCCFTFTRAAEKTGVSSENSKSDRTAESKPANEKSQSSAQVQIGFLKKQLQETDEAVKKAQDRADRLRRELRISDIAAEGAGSIALKPETVHRLEAARIEVESQYQGVNSLVTLLKAKSEAELQRMIDVVVSDDVMTSLLKAKAENEQRLANLSSKFGPENAELKALREENRKVSDQIAERAQGILAGLVLRAAAMKTQMESLYRAVDEAKAKDAELAAKYRPYFEAKRSLENLEKIRDAISLRLEQERIDATLPKFKQ